MKIVKNLSEIMNLMTKIGEFEKKANKIDIINLLRKVKSTKNSLIFLRKVFF
jgi:hypothetical protein